MHTWEQIYLLYMSDASFFWELFLISLEPFIRMHGRKFNHVQFFNNDWSIIWKQIVYGYRREAYMGKCSMAHRCNASPYLYR
jgi:hypothetical protein